MHTKHRTLDFIASLFTVFDVDWDTDFGEDGYTDFWGRAPINEPLFIQDLSESSPSSAETPAVPMLIFPKKRA